MKDLSNSKIWIGDDPELSEKVQKRLFELGIIWSDSSTSIKDVRAIYIKYNNVLTYTKTSKEEYFGNSRFKEIFLSDLFEEERVPKVGETWQYCNKHIYIIGSFGSNHKKVNLIRADDNSIIENYILEFFKNDNWKKTSSNQEEDLSKVPYTEWEVGDTIERINTDDSSTICVGTRWLVFEKPTNKHSIQISHIDSNQLGGFYVTSNFKLVKRANQSTIQDDFVLPEKWCTPHTQDVVDWLIKIEGNNLNGWREYPKLFIHFNRLSWIKSPVQNEIKDSYTFITTEQFQKYILKQSSVDNTELLKNQINNLNKQENVNNKSSEQGIKVFRSNISISEGTGIRGSSIKSTRSKIYVGSNNSYNK